MKKVALVALLLALPILAMAQNFKEIAPEELPQGVQELENQYGFRILYGFPRNGYQQYGIEWRSLNPRPQREGWIRVWRGNHIQEIAKKIFAANCFYKGTPSRCEFGVFHAYIDNLVYSWKQSNGFTFVQRLVFKDKSELYSKWEQDINGSSGDFEKLMILAFDPYPEGKIAGIYLSEQLSKMPQFFQVKGRVLSREVQSEYSIPESW